MGKKEPKIDQYIEKSANFARPILRHFRNLVHQACPGVEEAMKWSFPHFLYKGMLCNMAAFKNHCSIGFWKSSLILGGDAKDGAMGHFGRITSLADLPPEKELIRYIKKAADLNEAGVKVPKPVRGKAPKEVTVPDDLLAALKKNRKALETFKQLSTSHKREYVEWITEAKTEETRKKRLVTALEWMAEGKSRNWKYMK